MKKIFITGGAGFIANALVKRLIDDYKITVYDNFYRGKALINHPNMTVVEGDILNEALLTESMKGADVVIHAAAIAGIDTVIKDPVQTMTVNVVGIANVLKAAHINQVRGRFVDFSTSEVFGSMAYKSTEASETVSGSAGEARWVYAVSKLAGEHLAHAYFKQHQLPTVTVRPFNVYGAGQTGEGAMQIFINRALNNEDIYINGDGSQIRAWCYIDDFVDGVMCCLKDPKAIGESFNIGNARAVITTIGLAETVVRVLGSQSKILFRPKLSADIELRIPSVDKAEELLGFKASVSIEQGILATAKGLKIPLAKPSIKQDDIDSVVRVLRSGKLTQGNEVERLEKAVAAYVGAEYAVAVSSGTAGLHLSLLAHGIGKGDEVIVPAFSFMATANVVEMVGAKPVFCDVYLEGYSILIPEIKQHITPATKAIMPVHEFGQACEIEYICEIVDKHGLIVIEDAACALGAKAPDGFVGTFGNAGVYSFHPRKIITSGEGGMVVTNQLEVAEKIRALRNHGAHDGEFVMPGLNYRMTEFQAALVHSQLERLDDMIAERNRIAAIYMNELPERLHPVWFWRNTWQTFHILLDSTEERSRVMQALKNKGIESNYGAQCIPAQRYYQEKYELDCNKLFPNAMKAYTRGLALPMYQGLSIETIKTICNEIKRA